LISGRVHESLFVDEVRHAIHRQIGEDIETNVTA
jgi:hypothetical protein